jgi:hypothetical protein
MYTQKYFFGTKDFLRKKNNFWDYLFCKFFRKFSFRLEVGFPLICMACLHTKGYTSDIG